MYSFIHSQSSFLFLPSYPFSSLPTPPPPSPFPFLFMCVCFVISCLRAHDRARLRLAAACGLLKVATSSVHSEFITQRIFQRLALMMQVGICRFLLFLLLILQCLSRMLFDQGLLENNHCEWPCVMCLHATG